MHTIIISPCITLWLLCSSSNWKDINLSTIPWSFWCHSDCASYIAFFIPLVLIQQIFALSLWGLHLCNQVLHGLFNLYIFFS
jgi:hypothetical protein